MENNSLQSSAKRLSRKNTLKRSTYNSSSKLIVPVYSPDELKMLAMLSLIRMFQQERAKTLQKYEQQMELKLTQTGVHFNQPTKKQIVHLNNAAKIFNALQALIQRYLKTNIKAQCRKSLNSSFINIGMLESVEPSLETTVAGCRTSKKTTETLQKLDIKESNKENMDQCNNSTHRRYWSNISMFSRKSSPNQMVSLAERREKFFLLKKKQELQFLQKITVDFNSEQAQFKALVEMMEMFLKNLNRANYYLKLIDHNTTKCEKMNIYLKELIKIFQDIVTIFTALSKVHKALNIAETSNLAKAEFGQTSLLVQSYYEKSNQTIRIMRHFSLSPVFALYVTPFKKQCSRLIYCFVEARYTLRYLQKEIQNLEYRKKECGQIPKWQRAYRIKFLPKNTIC